MNRKIIIILMLPLITHHVLCDQVSSNNLTVDELINLPFSSAESMPELCEQATPEEGEHVQIPVAEQSTQVPAKSGLGQRVILDRILVRVNGINVLASDLTAARINEPRFTLERAIAAALYRQEASKRNLLPTAEDIEKKVASIKGAANLTAITDEEFEKYLTAEGFSLKQYKREIARLMSESNLLNALQQERIFVRREEVAKYYEEHPEYTESSYSLETALIPFSRASSEQEALAQTGLAEWLASGWMKEREIAEKLRSVTQLHKGEIAAPLKTSAGFQLVRLADVQPARLLTLEERYGTIEQALFEEQRAQFEEQMLEELKQNAIIVYLEPLTSVQPELPHTTGPAGPADLNTISENEG